MSEAYLNRESVMKVLDEFRKEYPYIVSPKNRIETIPSFYIDDDTSDGYHTFGELYHHRAVLFSVICNTFPYNQLAWKSKQHDDPVNNPMYEGMFIVGIETPRGQATYHYDIDPYWDMFNVKELETAPKWDGHTPSEAIERISSLNEYYGMFFHETEKCKKG